MGLKTYGVGIVGLGSIARKMHIPAIMECSRTRLVGVMSRSGDKAKQWAEKYRLEFSTNDLESLCDYSGVDIVVIASPNNVHLEHFREAARRGKHVLIEKPLAATGAEAAEIVKLAKAAGIKVAVAFQRNFSNASFLALRSVQSGLIGKSFIVKGRFLQDIRVWESEVKDWRFDPGISGGGAFLDVGSHVLDNIRFILDVHWQKAQFITKPAAFIPENKSDEITMTLIEYDKGVLGEVIATYFSPFQAIEVEIMGDKGFLRYNIEGDSIQVKTDMPIEDAFEPTEIEIIFEPENGWHTLTYYNPNQAATRMYYDLVDAIETGREPVANAETGAELMRLMDVIYGRA